MPPYFVKGFIGFKSFA